MTRIHLDHAATTPLAAAVLEEMLPYLTTTQGNPSSVHASGRAARSAVDGARDRVASLLGCAQREIVFTGSGTEADNLALRGVLERRGAEVGRHMVVSAIEHDAILETARHLEAAGAATLTVAGCDHDCRVSPESVAAAVGDDTVLVSVMFVNNETGAIQDVAAIAEAVHRRNPRTLVHTDAVQALGRIPVHPDALGVDLLSLSAHKIYGPKGVGALWIRHGVALAAQSTGGGQERARRSATENVAGIVGLAAAADLAEQVRVRETDRQRALCEPTGRGCRSAGPGRDRDRSRRCQGGRVRDVCGSWCSERRTARRARHGRGGGFSRIRLRERRAAPLARAPSDGVPRRPGRRRVALHHRPRDHRRRTSMRPPR